jgi:hypothetical protein
VVQFKGTISQEKFFKYVLWMAAGMLDMFYD